MDVLLQFLKKYGSSFHDISSVYKTICNYEMMQARNNMENVMENILIIAENEELGEILTNYLNSNNFNTHAASCLEDAQERLRETQYNLVIADLPSMKIPDLELCQRLRSVEQDLPMLFMCDIEGNFFTGFHLQFVEYIIKPFRKDEFNRKIRTLMGDSIKKQIVVSA